MDVEAYFIVDTVGKLLDKVVGGPYWTELQAEAKLDRMRAVAGDPTRYRIREAHVVIKFKDSEE